MSTTWERALSTETVPGPEAATTGSEVDHTGVVTIRRPWWWLGALALALAVSGVASVCVGAVSVPISETIRIVGHNILGWPGTADWRMAHGAIVWDVRIPRVLLAMLVGAGLASCGVALQAMVRNVLADPYLLGVNSGASTGAAAAILFGLGAGAGQHVLPASAFAGALFASALVLAVARSGGRVTSIRLLLAGVAVGYALFALTAFLVFASQDAEGSRSVMFWLLGSLSLASWSPSIAILAGVLAVTVCTLLAHARHLDLIAIGDATAHALGVEPDRLRRRLLVVVALCIGAVVSSAGAVGFVGLVVPHLARRIVGAAHVAVVPVSALLGALLLVWTDVLARMLFAPQDLPVGVVTAAIGAPFLLILIRRFHATTV